jgi:hypothetical protein
MVNKFIGLAFIFFAVFLYSVQIIAAAIFGSGLNSWSRELYLDILGYIGNGPRNLSLLSLLIGIIYLNLKEITNLVKNIRQK